MPATAKARSIAWIRRDSIGVESTLVMGKLITLPMYASPSGFFVSHAVAARSTGHLQAGPIVPLAARWRHWAYHVDYNRSLHRYICQIRRSERSRSLTVVLFVRAYLSQVRRIRAGRKELRSESNASKRWRWYCSCSRNHVCSRHAAGVLKMRLFGLARSGCERKYTSTARMERASMAQKSRRTNDDRSA